MERGVVERVQESRVGEGLRLHYWLWLLGLTGTKVLPSPAPSLPFYLLSSVYHSAHLLSLLSF